MPFGAPKKFSACQIAVRRVAKKFGAPNFPEAVPNFPPARQNANRRVAENLSVPNCPEIVPNCRSARCRKIWRAKLSEERSEKIFNAPNFLETRQTEFCRVEFDLGALKFSEAGSRRFHRPKFGGSAPNGILAR